MRSFLSRTLQISAAILAIAVFAFPAAGQGARRFLSISGNVRDDVSQAALENIRIELHADSGELVTQTFTTSTGAFEFGGLRAGSYLVIIQVSGYEPLRESVDLLNASHGGLLYSLRRLPDKSNPVPPSDQPSVSARELKLPPKAQDALHKGLDKLYAKKDPDGSIAFFRKVLEISPDFYEAHYYIGMAYMFTAKLPEAEVAFRTAIEHSEDHYADPHIALATLLIDNKRAEEAEENARRGVELDPQSWQGHLELAKALLALNRPADAEKSGLVARKLKPDFPNLYITLANIHIRLQNAPALLDDVNTYLKLAPDGPYSERAKQIKSTVEKQSPSGTERPESWI